VGTFRRAVPYDECRLSGVKAEVTWTSLKTVAFDPNSDIRSDLHWLLFFIGHPVV